MLLKGYLASKASNLRSVSALVPLSNNIVKLQYELLWITATQRLIGTRFMLQVNNNWSYALFLKMELCPISLRKQKPSNIMNFNIIA